MGEDVSTPPPLTYPVSRLSLEHKHWQAEFSSHKLLGEKPDKVDSNVTSETTCTYSFVYLLYWD